MCVCLCECLFFFTFYISTNFEVYSLLFFANIWQVTLATFPYFPHLHSSPAARRPPPPPQGQGLQRVAFWSRHLHNQIRMRDRQRASPIRGCSRGERALSSATMEGSPPLFLSLSLQPCTCSRKPNPTRGCTPAPERRSCADSEGYGACGGELEGKGAGGWSKIFKHAGCELALKG